MRGGDLAQPGDREHDGNDRACQVEYPQGVGPASDGFSAYNGMPSAARRTVRVFRRKVSGSRVPLRGAAALSFKVQMISSAGREP